MANRQNIQQLPSKTPTDTSLSGVTARDALAALEKNNQALQGNTAIPQRAMTQNADGINTSGSVMSKQTVPALGGLTGVRAMANNAGIQNVGWDGATGSVTFDGKEYVKPAKVTDDGTAYTDRQTMQSAINQYYKDNGMPLAGADSYVSGQLGVKGAVSWSDGNLMVGGQIVPTVYVDDNGTAYARRSDLDNAIKSYRSSSGVTGNQGVYDNWSTKYGGRINDALDAVLNRKEWSYDTESDNAYQAYKEAYMREGNRAYQNAYAQMAANTGGYGSSAGMSAAGQQMNYYMQQLGDRVPELMQNSYNRYLGEQELRRAALNSILGVANDDYSKAYQVNRDSVSDANEANYQSFIRSMDARDYNRQALEADRQWQYQEPILREQAAQAALSTQAQQLTNMLSKYQYSGNIDTPISAEDAQAAGIPRKADGTYPTIREIQNSYADLQYGNFENYDLRTLAAELALRAQYK